MRLNRWLTGIAVVGTVATVLAVGLLWLVVMRPDAAGMTLGLWLSTAR
jgi:hypothetical protein